MLLSLDLDLRADQLFTDPPAGKTIIVVAGRKRLEDMYVTHTEDLEQKGVTLLCQGFSGGMGRMQAEFDALEGNVIMALSAFQVEAMHIARPQVAQFYIESLPFDHPNHPVVSKRGELFKNSFTGYSLPRLQHRLFRLAKVFARLALPGATITLLDKRLGNKPYAQRVLSYWRELVEPVLEESNDDQEGEQLTLL